MDIDDIDDIDDVEAMRVWMREQRRRQQELAEEVSAAMEEASAAKEEARAAKEHALAAEERAVVAEERVRPTMLSEYLEGLHKLNLSLEVVLSPSRTTGGEAVKPAGRRFPARIVPWTDFTDSQDAVWDLVEDSSPGFRSARAFPSAEQLDGFGRYLRPVSSETGLQNFEKLAVELAVELMATRAVDDPKLREALNLRGTVTFESHANLGTPPDENDDGDGNPPRRKAAVGKGISTLADQWCVYRTTGGPAEAVLGIEYKPPHKLAEAVVIEGLKEEIQPARDVINVEGEGFAYDARRLSAAVVTQLFTYMLGKGLRHGYVCSSETFVFMYLDVDDPSEVRVAVCVPGQDVMDGDATRLRRTAAAQVFAFLLQALRAPPPSQAWHEGVKKLGIWDVEFDDVLSRIPPSARKRKRPSQSPSRSPSPSPYVERYFRAAVRSRVVTRSGCKEPTADAQGGRDDNDDGNDGTVPSPTPRTRTQNRTRSTAGGSSARAASGGQRQQAGDKQRQGSRRDHNMPAAETTHATQPVPPTLEVPKGTFLPPGTVTVNPKYRLGPPPPPAAILGRPYCTAACLLGLMSGGAPADPSCPNYAEHERAYGPPLDAAEFLAQLRAQLAWDRGYDAECATLHIQGSRGALFKVRLRSHGYTAVAKAVEPIDFACLQRELDVYTRLAPLQGKHIPVCVGQLDLVKPLYYDFGAYERAAVLSWAGKMLAYAEPAQLLQLGEGAVVGQVRAAFDGMHALGVLQRDAELRNMMLDDAGQKVQVIDFERAEILPPPLPLPAPLAAARFSIINRKRRRAGDDSPKCAKNNFRAETDHAVRAVAKYMATLQAQQETKKRGTA